MSGLSQQKYRAKNCLQNLRYFFLGYLVFLLNRFEGIKKFLNLAFKAINPSNLKNYTILRILDQCPSVWSGASI